ncbi:MAG: DinB family protein [Flavobacteriales bacterium]|jgi:uncharacterized damage-inducible protein DinB|nr:DinB family protein [Flavobacteriales bacterium]MBK7942160.1 DinB family protein [Flavobacteriales bacterium]MBK8949638.1 DinB family protein [Flavobacteriales bacterium]MBK9700701.1 DinB family protein [Flavobacteriales bacterium]
MSHLSTLIQQYAAYDHWASTAFVDRLKEEPDALLDRHAASSFPTLRGTLMHIRDAENAWFLRLTGATMRWPAEPTQELDTLMPHVERFTGYARSLDEEGLMATCRYHDLKGNPYAQPAWQMIMHALNHSSYHRGQVVTQMRALGLERIPRTDLVAFQRLAGA